MTETPKQIAVIQEGGRHVVVARTFDVIGLDAPGDYDLMLGRQPIGSLYRDNYDTIRRMVHRFYPAARWLEAAEYDL